VIETPGVLWTILSFFLMIGPLIFIHEMGHYLAGRAFGVKADAFSIGFGRELFGWTDKRGTRWKVGMLPLGGYVKFAGDMNPASTPSPEWLALSPQERAQTFQAAKLWQKFLIVAAGPAVNFAFAIAVFAAVFSFYGEPRTPTVIGNIQVGSAADKAGIEVGDRILSIDGREMPYWDDVVQMVVIWPGKPLDIRIERDGRTMELIATPSVDIRQDRFGNTARVGLLGVLPGRPVVEKLGPVEVLGASLRYTFNAVQLIIDTTGQIIMGERSVKELGGPLKIAQLSGQQASQGWFPFILFMTMISINLGFINLLPVPLLDGGHLLFYLIEGIRRRPLPPQAMEWAFRSGLAVLLTLMVFVTVNDLGSFGLWERVAGLIG